MVFKVKGLVAALESHQSVGLEGWWDTLVTAIVGVEDLDNYKGRKYPWSNEYKELMRKTFANPRWVAQQQLVEGNVSAGGIASRLNGYPDTKDYFDNIRRTVSSLASWVPGYIKVVKEYNDAVRGIHADLIEKCKNGIEVALVKEAIKAISALPHPGRYVVKHGTTTIDGAIIKTDKRLSGWTLGRPKAILPKEIPALTEKQFHEAVKIIVDISEGTHLLNKLSSELDRVMVFEDFKDGNPFWKNLQELDDDLFNEYCDLTYHQTVWDDLDVPGLYPYQIQAALVIWAARSTGKTGASLESHQSVGLESWWDTLVDAITGVKNIDDYRGKKTPWSDEYKKLMRGTFANSRWVSKQKLVDGLVAGGGISKRFGCISNSTDYWANVQLAIENSKWIDDYLKVLKKYSDDIRAIHEKLGKDYRESPDLALVRAAIKEIKALEHPMAYIVKHAKPCLHGKIMPDGKSYKIVPQNTKFESKVPALTQSQFEEAVKIIVAIHNETHPLCKQRDAFWDAAQFCDDDDLISELMDENEELGMQYSDLTYWQAVIDDVTPPGDEYEVIQAGLVLWAARSCGSTAASLESFNGTTVDLETIARTGHEAVRSLAQSFGDHSHLSWEESPDWVRNSAINGAALHVLNPGLSAEATHEAWLKAKQEEGWSCGPTKDADRKEHPCMVPYSELSTEHRLKDHLFKSVVDAFVACLKERQPDVEIVGLECACGSLEQQYDGSLDGQLPVTQKVDDIVA